MKRSVLFIGTILLLTVLAVPPFVPRVAAALPSAYFYPVRRFNDSRLPDDTGLAYDSGRGLLLALRPAAAGDGLLVQEFDRVLEDERGETSTTFPSIDPRNITFDSTAGRLMDLSPGLPAARGAVLDEATGLLYQLDSQTLTIHAFRAGESEAVRSIPLRGVGTFEPSGLARNPNNGHFYSADASGERILEIDADGQAVAVLDLASSGLRVTGGMVFAPSGDSTDDPNEHSLYMVAAVARAAESQQEAASQIIEITLVAPPQIDAPELLDLDLVRTINTYAWSPSSPDPSGMSYWPDKGSYLVSDGEVDSYNGFNGDNLYQMNAAGTLLNSFSAMFYTSEPTGVSVNPNSGEIYISDDDRRRIYIVDLGPDGALQTSDDKVTYFSTSSYSADPEGVSWGNGYLFIVDGTNSQVYVISPGPNGRFNGISPAGDDVMVRSFDTERMGVADPEGIEYHPHTGTLFIAGNNSRDVLIECTTSGTPVKLHNVSEVPLMNPAGVGIGPSSFNASVYSIYITDRRTDGEDSDPKDGKIFEIDISDGAPPTATNTPIPTATNTPTPTATPTRTPAPLLKYKIYFPFLPYNPD